MMKCHAMKISIHRAFVLKELLDRPIALRQQDSFEEL